MVCLQFSAVGAQGAKRNNGRLGGGGAKGWEGWGREEMGVSWLCKTLGLHYY